MTTYQSLKARMKGHTPPNWSPAMRAKKDQDDVPPIPFGEGLVEVERPNEQDSPPVNTTIYQAFEWYTPSWSTPVTVPQIITTHDVAHSDATTVTTTRPAPQSFALSSHYSVVTSIMPSLFAYGITSIWLPPGCKASNPQGNGYDIYDLYDLGEFDTKGSKATKWGSKEELVALGTMAKQFGIGLLWDAVLNHRAAADGKERARAIAVKSKDRRLEQGSTKDVETWTCFNYTARHGKYSNMIYNWRHFSGIDWDDLTHSKSILKFVGDDKTIKPGWSPEDDVDTELGNYDYLMFADVDYTQPDVQRDVLNWSTWLSTQVPGLAGLRLDAVKHYSARFQYQLINHLRSHSPSTANWFFVGEYWRADSKFLARHIDRFAGHMHLFDVKLVYNFADFAAGRLRDLRSIFKDSLVELRPNHAVTFVTNHDTQATQSLACPVLPWFHPHAYALILLRQSGTPCIFHGDVFGTLGPSPTTPSSTHGNRLMRMSLIRKLYAYGPQHDFFVARDLIAWSREGIPILKSPDRNGNQIPGGLTATANSGLCVVLCTGWKWKKLKVYVGRKHAGETWTDMMGWSWDEVVVDGKGWGVFKVGPRSLGCWTKKGAVGRELVDEVVWPVLEGGNGEDEGD